jgi:hypothetical protein
MKEHIETSNEKTDRYTHDTTTWIFAHTDAEW